jgi:hypothetical protein
MSMTELGDEKWLLGLVLLCDSSQHLNDLNTKLQGQQKLVSDIFEARAFEMTLKLLWKQLEN